MLQCFIIIQNSNYCSFFMIPALLKFFSVDQKSMVINTMVSEFLSIILSFILFFNDSLLIDNLVSFSVAVYLQTKEQTIINNKRMRMPSAS